MSCSVVRNKMSYSAPSLLPFFLPSLPPSLPSQMGVSQVGVRKRILDGILEIHKKQWDMPQNNLPYNRPIKCGLLHGDDFKPVLC